MTCQEIVARMVQEDSENWVMDLLLEAFDSREVYAEDVRLNDLPDGKAYFCKVVITNGFNMPIDSVEVSGKITNRVKHEKIAHNGKTIWHDSKFIREDMGIKVFKMN